MSVSVSVSSCFHHWLYTEEGLDLESVIIVCIFSQGLRNDLKDAMDKLDQEYLTQLALQQVHMLYTHTAILSIMGWA